MKKLANKLLIEHLNEVIKRIQGIERGKYITESQALSVIQPIEKLIKELTNNNL